MATDTPKVLLKRFLYNSAKYIHHLIRLKITRPAKIWLGDVMIELDESFSDKMLQELYLGTYEAAEAKCLMRRLQSDDIVMDFGAGIGYLSTLCAMRIGSDRVFSYEANPSLIPSIKRTFFRNQVKPKLRNVLLGTYEGEGRFFLEPAFYSSSIYRRSDAARQIEVQVADINEEIRKTQVTFMIVDIEGGEWDLLPYIEFGSVRKLLIELHEKIIGKEKVDRVRALLTERGFTVDSKISNGTVVFLEKLTP